MDVQSNNLNWFEIPVEDIDRAKSFYENIFQIDMPTNEMMDMKLAFFPYEMGSGKAAGGLVQGPMHKPSKEGAVIYLNAGPDLQTTLDRIEGAGGEIVMPKTPITEEIGYMAFFIDSEGNKLALHSPN